MGKGAGRGSGSERRALAVLGLLAAAAVAGCGSDGSLEGNRPPAPIEVAAKIDAGKVAVAPDNFGAGDVNFTVANFSDSTVRFELEGPKRASTSEIKPGEPASLQIQLPEGDYEASAVGDASARPARFTVAKQRPSSDGRLLLP
jgi:hypothetical protein